MTDFCQLRDFLDEEEQIDVLMLMSIKRETISFAGFGRPPCFSETTLVHVITDSLVNTGYFEDINRVLVHTPESNRYAFVRIKRTSLLDKLIKTTPSKSIKSKYPLFALKVKLNLKQINLKK